jgi:hypothetical protein
VAVVFALVVLVSELGAFRVNEIAPFALRADGLKYKSSLYF